MKNRSVVDLAIAVTIQAAAASSAWTEFVAYKAPVVAPEGRVNALNLAGAATVTLPTATVQEYSASPSFTTTVTLNKFINSNSANTTRAKVFALCKAGSAGTTFGATMATITDVKAMPPQCFACLAKGWGTDEKTPGFYLPCGCSDTCVDVSGNVKANFNGQNKNTVAVTDTSASDLSSLFKSSYWPVMPSGGNMQPLKTCDAYLQNGLVQNCGGVARYHFALWISLIAVAAMLFTAYSMMYMQLDMDSLLFESGSKKDN